MIQFVWVQDLEEIYNAIYQCADDLYNQKLNNPVDIMKLACKYSQCALVVVAKENEKVMGIAAYYANDCDGKNGFLSMLVVKQIYQHKGIGKGLLKLIECDCKKRGMNIMRLEVDRKNFRAQKFYFKDGFVITEKKEYILMMAKELKKL